MSELAGIQTYIEALEAGRIEIERLRAALAKRERCVMCAFNAMTPEQIRAFEESQPTIEYADE